MLITNNLGINLPLAVWLVHDDYDYIDAENYISATGLMRPLKQLILAGRVPPAEKTSDVADYIARALGHAIHDSIEKAWTTGHRRNLKILGYTDDVIDRIRINPTPEELRARNDIIPVYMEQRAFKEHMGYTIGGKFDLVADGVPQDYKSTSAFSWLFGTRDDDHRLQLSIYKWLNPDKITEDFGVINYIFTDWSKVQAKSNQKYPQKRVESKQLILMSPAETEQWVTTKLLMVQTYKDKPEEQIPDCTDEELWRSDPVYKYYSNPANTQGRSTRNFDNLADANAFMASKGGVGVVKTIPGEPKACGYCPAFNVCKQKDRYFP